MNRHELDNTRLLLPSNRDGGFRALKFERDNQKRNIEKRQQARLSIFSDRRTAGQILPEERVCGCGKIPISAPGARIQVAGEKGKYFSGVMNCGSVWNCPVCAKKIGLNRAATVTNFLREFQKAEIYSLGFLTLTIRHHSGEQLKDVLKKVLKSFREIEQSRKFRDMKKQFDFKGCIRTVEIKHGGNGWHPHLHLLLIGKCTDEELKLFSDFFIDEWLKKNSDASIAAQKYLPVQNEEGIAEYITKWNAATEMTMGSEKGNGISLTPFQFLKVYAYSYTLRSSSNRQHWENMVKYRELFKEYSAAMKGKKQLTISRDLIREFELITNTKFSMKTDEEINTENQNEKNVVEIDRELFKIIASYNMQGGVLNKIEFDGVQKCVEWLNDNFIECEFDPHKNIIQPPQPPEEEIVIYSDNWDKVSTIWR